MNKFLFCMAFMVVCGCGCQNERYVEYGEVTWYPLPYDLPREENAFGGKSWRNVELDASKNWIIWPFSVALDSDSCFARVWVFCQRGRCSVWYDSGQPWMKSCMMYTALKDAVWLRIEHRIITNNRLRKDRSRKTDWADVVEITEDEFRRDAKKMIPGVRFVELKGRQVVVGSCGRLRGYILKDVNPKGLKLDLVEELSSDCKQPVIPEGIYMAGVGESKITVVGNDAELDLSLGSEKNKRFVAQGRICNGHRACPDGISGQPIYFITTSTQFSPFEILELSWFYDGQNILAVYPDKKTVTFTLNEAVGFQKTYKPSGGRPQVRGY